MTKESLREKFGNKISWFLHDFQSFVRKEVGGDKSVAIDITSTKKEIMDFFWNEIEEIRREAFKQGLEQARKEYQYDNAIAGTIEVVSNIINQEK